VCSIHQFKWHLACLWTLAVALTVAGCVTSPQKNTRIASTDLQQALRPVNEKTAYAGFDGRHNQFYLGNAFLERRILLSVDGTRLQTISIFDKVAGRYSVAQASEEFRFQVAGLAFSGVDSLLRYQRYDIVSGLEGSRKLIIWMSYNSVTPESEIDLSPTLDNLFPHPRSSNFNFRLQICYQTYPNQPRIDKWLVFENRSNAPLVLQGIVVESLPILYPFKSQLLTKRTGGHLEIYQSPELSGQRIALTNQAPGILKFFDVYRQRDMVSVGLGSATLNHSTKISVFLNQPVKIPAVSCTADTFMLDQVLGQSVINQRYLKLEDLKSYHVLDFEPDNLSALTDELSGKAGRRRALFLPVATVGKEFLDRPDWQLSNPTDSTIPIYCLLSEYGFFMVKAVEDLMDRCPLDLLILSGPIFENRNSALLGCDKIEHGHPDQSESIFLTYKWLFNFSLYIQSRYPDVKLGVTAVTYGVDLPDYACWQYFDFFVP